jgi:hypothetical protein
MSEIKLDKAIVMGKATDTLDFELAKRCAEALNQHYPGYAWAVNVDRNTGMAQVRNLTLSGEWGFNIHLVRINSDPSFKVLIQAGGEILERYRVKRGKASEDQIETLKTDVIGRFIVDSVGAV